jgi:mycothiol synthase
MTGGGQRVIGKSSVTEREAEEIRELAEVCNQLEGLDLKLGVPTAVAPGESMPRAFLVYAEGSLAGYCGLDYGGGTEAELCGVVRPERRRQGIGRALLEAAREASRTRGIERLLVICEDASESGRGFVARSGARLTASELHMEREARAQEMGGRARGATGSQLTVRQATARDVETVTRIMSAAFQDDEEAVRRRVSREIVDAHGPFLLAERDGVAVGSLKVYAMGPETGIYAFGVLPEHQGRGYGRAFLMLAMERLAANGDTRFVLEVDPDNAPAIAVYRACGFTPTTTYGYYALDV